ncbi:MULTISPECIES: thiolase C-terminal domain-containing protein [Aminobacter]|jgi:acetyl-CoA acetyltransferase|uniref:Acetyl-CoA acetyltransferase n=2 Tax=Aminobacter TaxID=31988 RepID=A0AAC8YL16_AMIAI|nr:MULTISPECIES: lipid-transfer protein [Aminobacter]AMS40420.1 lipid-transfer protein [Aminobacter aminovorans]MBA8905643.1 acetyl-CoA acetyltransferase [Aminobacter ciceronei]MBA9019422.1 acetyl-CoA acetyltransferase [Aminobacter ciceronei]MBB3708050.1 acetyl-CoA acetyltransferase [Aminobacter aminovorans]
MSDMISLKDRTAIVGIGETAFGKAMVQSEEQLACMAIKAALDDAGISPSEVDGLCSLNMENVFQHDIARDLGMKEVTYYSQMPAGGHGGCGTVGHAAMAIATGQAKVVVGWRSRKRSGRASRVWAQLEQRIQGSRDTWLRPWGIIRPVDEVGVMYTRYMHEFGATRDHLANVALAFRSHANRNPKAFMHAKPMSREDYFAARWISEPLCLFDCCLETDGAIAFVVTAVDRARDCRNRPVYVHAAAQGFDGGSAILANYFTADPMRSQAATCAKSLWRQSDFRAADIKVAQFYDAFTPEVFFTLEGYGFCGRGEGAAFTEDGGVALGGRLPVNTGGGSLSEVYLHGFNMITEGVKQMRGTSTGQVEQADCCFVSSSDLGPTCAVVLRN